MNLLLHFYQPPNQKPELLKKVVTEAYEPIIEILEQNPQAKVLFNIQPRFLERLQNEFPEWVKRVNKLLVNDQIEIVASIKCHAVLPLLSEIEIDYQIKEGKVLLEEILGKTWQSNLFFPPEFAIDHKTYEFYKIHEPHINILSREDLNIEIIKALREGRVKLEELKKIKVKENKMIATDAEIYGHHYQDRLEWLKWIIKNSNIKNSIRQPVEKIKKFSSWEDENLWSDPDNPIQQTYLKLMRLSLDSYWDQRSHIDKEDERLTWSRIHLDNGLSSCCLFWASCKPWWNPDYILYGAEQLIKVTRTLDLDNHIKLQAEQFYNKIMELVWYWHWGGEAQKRIDEFEKIYGHGLFWVRQKPAHW